MLLLHPSSATHLAVSYVHQDLMRVASIGKPVKDL
jgi:hypothetical protein